MDVIDKNKTRDLCRMATSYNQSPFISSMSYLRGIEVLRHLSVHLSSALNFVKP